MKYPALLLSLPLLVTTFAAHAQDYPNKPIKFIVPYPPGGATDAIVRPVTNALNQSLGQQIVLENRGGAGTTIGAAAAAKSPADGYTYLVCGNATHSMSAHLYPQLPFNPLTDFDPVTIMASSPTVLFAHVGFPHSNVGDLIKAAKANPNKFTFVTSGSGTPPHLSTEIFMEMTGIKMVQVPYKGGGDALADMIAGRVDMKFGSAPEAIPPVKGGKLKALAIALDNRWPDLPHVPTFKESGFPNYKTGTWYGICAPAKTPAAMIDRVYKATATALASPELKKQLQVLGAVPGGIPPAEFAAFIRTDYEVYGKIIRSLNLKAE